MYHSEAFYQYLLRGRRGPLTFVPLATDFELFDQSHFHKTKTPPTTTPTPPAVSPAPTPLPVQYLPPTVGDGTHSDRTLDSRAGESFKNLRTFQPNLLPPPRPFLYISTSSVQIVLYCYWS